MTRCYCRLAPVIDANSIPRASIMNTITATGLPNRRIVAVSTAKLGQTTGGEDGLAQEQAGMKQKRSRKVVEKKKALLERLELPTPALGRRRSIQLSYSSARASTIAYHP